MAKKVLCDHVVVLPEAATIVFGGGFWRLESASAKMAAQRAIFHVQREMEYLVVGEKAHMAMKYIAEGLPECCTTIRLDLETTDKGSIAKPR